MLRLPSSSPLFPYTTLFRSHSLVRLHRYRYRSSVEAARETSSDLDDFGWMGQHESQGLHGLGDEEGVKRGCCDLQRGDRKSTRLNSSHLGISYAVFCLKKKI